MKLIENRSPAPIQSFTVPEIGGTFEITVKRGSTTLSGRRRLVLRKTGYAHTWDIDEEQIPLLIEALQRYSELAS